MRKQILIVPLTLLLLLALNACGTEQYMEPQENVLIFRPDGFPSLKIPEDNPITQAGVNLGRRLFYDPILSDDSTQSCASCHNQAYGFTDNGLQFSTGIDGIEGDRNAMQIINLMWADEFFWDGRTVGLEAQALEPVTNPIEMHETWPDVVEKLSAHPLYPKWFDQAFGPNSISPENAAKAISQFERTLISANSKYHKWRYGKAGGELTPQEERGRVLFFGEKAECFHCHMDMTFTDNQFHNNGLERIFNSENEGHFAITGDQDDMGAFRTPTLANIALTAPYMHDGRFQTLEEVVDHYSDNVQFSIFLDPLIRPNGFELDEQEKEDLVAFLHTLTDEEFLTNPDFSNPWE